MDEDALMQQIGAEVETALAKGDSLVQWVAAADVCDAAGNRHLRRVQSVGCPDWLATAMLDQLNEIADGEIEEEDE